MSSYIGLILFGTFALLLLLRVPVSFSLGISAIVCLMILKVPLVVIGQKMFTAIDSFPIMAIPFFILSGNLMIEGGLSKRLVKFASALLARVRGGLALASILACAMFGALSGSGPATVLSIGGMIYPELVERGYKKETMAGLIAAAGSLGPIIPPSIIMVFFGTVTGVSITKLFAGGIGVGLLLALVLFVVTAVMAVRGKWPKAEENEEIPGVWVSFKESFFALLMPIIVLGGIYGGFFTPTEAAAISIVYSFFVGIFIYKELNFKNVPPIIRDSAVSATIVLFIIASSAGFSWLFTYANIAAQINNFVFEMNLGADPIHFGLVVCFALTLGGLTPPVAVNLFSMASVSGLSMNCVIKGVIPFLITSLAVLLLVVFFPIFSTFFPSIMT